MIHLNMVLNVVVVAVMVILGLQMVGDNVWAGYLVSLFFLMQVLLNYQHGKLHPNTKETMTYLMFIWGAGALVFLGYSSYRLIVD